MANRKRRKSSGPNQSYMISFGDTMTALLAFFIVLNSLASEQTGANLYSGTGSFIQATDSLGVPGIFPHGQSLHAVQLKTSSPLYRIEDPEDGSKRGTGPDDENENLYIRDRELDDFERFLNEFERLYQATKQEQVIGEVAFDRHSPLPKKGTLLDQSLKQLFREIRPQLMRNQTEAEIIVWTPMPSAKSWQRSAQVANQLRIESASYLQLNELNSSRLSSSSKQWMNSDIERPVMTLILRRTSPEFP